MTKYEPLSMSNPPRNNQNSYNLHYVIHLGGCGVVFYFFLPLIDINDLLYDFQLCINLVVTVVTNTQ